MATRKKTARKKSNGNQRIPRPGPTHGNEFVDGFMSAFSAKDLKALEPDLQKVTDAMSKVDITGLKADAEELIPRQSDINKAVKEGLASIQDLQNSSVMPKLTKQQEEELRQEVELGLYDFFTSMRIDEDAIRYNMEQACYSTGIYNDQFYLVSGGQLLMLEPLKDTRGLTWSQLLQIGRVVIETFGLVLGMKSIWMKPNQYKVAKALGRCMSNPTFLNKTILFLTFMSERISWYQKAKAICDWIKAVHDLAKSQLRDLVQAFVDGYPWYKKVALIAQIISTIGGLVISYGTSLIIKIIYTIAAAIEYIQKIIETVLILRRASPSTA